MSALTRDQAEALRRLADVWKGTRFCLIGASALACGSARPDVVER